MTTLREAAQQALEAMSSFESGTGGLYEGEFSVEIAALRAALAKPREHITDGSPCWCNPETTYVDPDTGASVIVHKEPQ